MPILKSATILEQIGNTPLVRLENLEETGSAAIYAKVEAFNPGGSIKDRICLAMIEAAEKGGKLKAGATVVEPTSGNTGIGLSMVCAVRGYKLVLTMPDTMSIERRRLLAAWRGTGPYLRCPGDAGCGAESGRTGGKAWLPDAPAVQEPGKSRGAPADNRAGDHQCHAGALD